MINTYELLGTSFSTHRRGGIIDYVFLGPTSHFFVNEHYPVALKSDHSAVAVRLQLLSGPGGAAPPAFTPGTVTTDPNGTQTERRAIRRLQLQAIRSTPSGAAVHVASRRIRGAAVWGALTQAAERGVTVTVITGTDPLPARGVALRRMLGTDTAASQYVAQVDAWSSANASGPLSQTLVLASRTGATPAFALAADTPLTAYPLTTRFGRTGTAVVTVSNADYDARYQAYLAAVGRGY